MLGLGQLICCAIAVTGLVAQQPPSAGLSVHGVVRDQTGAILRGAIVEIVSDAGDTIATTKTDTNGEFPWDSIPIGA